MEDRRFVLILSKDDKGNKEYLCLGCGHKWHGNDGRLWPHFLRVTGKGVQICTRLPSTECRDLMERGRKLKEAGSKSGLHDLASGRTPSVSLPGVMASREKLVADADSALAEWMLLHDISERAVDSRSAAFRNVLQKIFLVGPSYAPPHRQTLMCPTDRGDGCRQSGLYLASQSVEREKALVWRNAEKTGGTVVSDGCKLSARKRGMLNTSIALPDGLEFLQQTDATGRKKDARFLSTDLSRALEKCGKITMQRMASADGTEEMKRSSSVVKIVILDRGGGCENAMKMLEEEWVVITDTCKTHGANLLSTDVGKPFKAHIKQAHELIIFITSHDMLQGIFSEYEGVRALLLPAQTRFLTEVCATLHPRPARRPMHAVSRMCGCDANLATHGAGRADPPPHGDRVAHPLLHTLSIASPLPLPARADATRSLGQVICLGSLETDKQQVQALFIDQRVIRWVDEQNIEMRQKFRKHKARALSDDFWHVNEVFVAVIDPISCSLRDLDTGKPNLKDAAFAFTRMELEYGDPLLGRLAKIKDWDTIDLNLDLKSEYMGDLASYAKPRRTTPADHPQPAPCFGWVGNPTLGRRGSPTHRTAPHPSCTTTPRANDRISHASASRLLLAAKVRQGDGQEAQGRLDVAARARSSRRQPRLHILKQGY